jgi:Family of unknown function (DUF6295)
VCTYLTEHVDVEGSAKFADGWAAMRTATVYFDHPVHALAEHTLNIDFFTSADATGRRVAVELTAPAARALAAAIGRAIASAPAELTAG